MIEEAIENYRNYEIMSNKCVLCVMACLHV
jgi:ferredoxin